MALLILKLGLGPVVVAVATLVARRLGPQAGGWVVGLPVTAAPVALVLALQHGPVFAAQAASGFLAGLAAQAAFALAYARGCEAGRGWGLALAAGTFAFVVTGALLTVGHLSAVVLCGLGIATLVLAIRLAPAAAQPERAARKRKELPTRMALSALLLVVIAGLAATVGPIAAGVLSSFPLLSSLLAVGAHRRDGPAAAVAVYRGLLVGLFSLAGFALVLAELLVRVPIAFAFVPALAIALAIQATSFQLVRRGSTPRLV